jgi:hypothetical protein
MAERNMANKNWAYLWQLVIAGAVIALLIWAGFKLFDQDAERARDMAHNTKLAVPATNPASIPEPVHEFVSYIQGNPAQEKMQLDHAFTSEGIRRLADALGAVAVRYDLSGVDVKADLDQLRHDADQLQQNQRSTEHADVIRSAFILSSDLMNSMQRQIRPHLNDEVAEVRQAAEAIVPDKLALQQKTEVEGFFKKAGSLLEDLARAQT